MTRASRARRSKVETYRFRSYTLPTPRRPHGSISATLPARQPLTLQLEQLIVRPKNEHPTRGAPKIREKLRRLHRHLTLKQEATRPAAKNFLQQQAKFDRFIECYNHERPHQALGMRYPAELYRPSPRAYEGLKELEYPFHDRTITVTACGRVCIGARKINLSGAFAGQNVGIKQVAEKVWLVSFMQYDLGFFDHESTRVECAPNPFAVKVLPMSPV